MHALDAVDLLLQRNGHRRFHHLRHSRPRSCLLTVTCGGARSGYKRDRQRGNANRARENDQQRANRRKNRAS